jgi:large repetitive protein
LSYFLTQAPTGLSIDNVSGEITWTPTAFQISQRFTLTVKPANRSPEITSLPVLSATAGLNYNYDISSSDADNDVISYSLTAAPTGMTIDALGRISWDTAIADIGTHSVTVRATDPLGASATQSYQVVVDADTESPRVLIEVGESPAALGAEVALLVSATDNVGVESLVLTVDGVSVAIDSDGIAVFNANSVGTVNILVMATDAANNLGQDAKNLQVIDFSDANAPAVEITSPSVDAVIGKVVDIVGTVTDNNLQFYKLEVSPLGFDTFTEIARGTNSVIGGLLGKFDPTMLQNDSYVLRLTATDTAGNAATTEQVVHIAGELKLGNFNLSFVDLTIPVFGVPITVGRTYDTLNASQSSDFGFGWRLEFRNMNLRTSVARSKIEEIGTFNPFKTGSRVYLTLPGGERQGFTFRPTVAAGFRGSFLGIFEPRFVPDAGVKSSLTVNAADLRFKADGTVYDYATGKAYNPADRAFGGSYLLTTKQGIAISVDAHTGDLTALSDPTNNVLQFSDAGITGPEGISVSFDRDPKGRITAVIDPAGRRIGYEYDARGDLVSVTDRTSNTTQFVYLSSPAHFLDKVIDPLGRTGVRTEYNAQGRLVKLLDAAGNPVTVHLRSRTAGQHPHRFAREHNDRIL